MGVGVGLGMADFPFSDAAAFWRWIDLCEQGGVDSMWQTDRLVSKQPILECMSVMAALAGATKKLKFGMNVASVGLRDPLLLAKQCATIDVLSQGRILPAFGIGNARGPEWLRTNIGTRGRGKRTDEGLEIIRRLWSEEDVSFHGTYYRYDGVTISPRPVQKKIPLWLGGSSEPAIRRTARFGTGWLAGLESPSEVARTVAGIKAALPEFGRSIDEDHYGAAFAFRFGAWDEPVVAKVGEALAKRTGRDPRDGLVVGDAQAIIARLEEFIAAGAFKFVLRPIAAGDDEVMDQTRKLIEQVLPRVESKRLAA